jgi:hypothetical protein
MNSAPTEKIKQDGALASVQALVALSEVDLLYADLYLHRAETFLPALCTREQYAALRRDKEHLPHVADELRQATERADWSRVRALAEHATAMQDRITAQQPALEAADAVYGPRILRAGPTALALNGVVAHPAASLERERTAVVAHLRLLAAADRDWRSLYEARAAHFGRLEVVADEQAGAAVDDEHLRKRVIAAVERGAFAEVRRLMETLLDSRHRLSRTRVPVPRNGRADALAAPFPDRSADRARDLGLIPEALPSSPSPNAYLSCCCADRMTFPAKPLSETHRQPDTCTCGHACPPDVPPSLRESLDLVLVHPFLSSAGTRYLPWFGSEAVLVETFPESDPEAGGWILGTLGLPRRRGLPRIAIEDALRSHGMNVCTALGLDPFEFVVGCIPFDAYARLAPAYGWGREQFWTHFDGYQVTRELHLLALVGGDARYGGPDGFCAVQRDYDPPRITARFCVLRRQRFLARERTESEQTEAKR